MMIINSGYDIITHTVENISSKAGNFFGLIFWKPITHILLSKELLLEKYLNSISINDPHKTLNNIAYARNSVTFYNYQDEPDNKSFFNKYSIFEIHKSYMLLPSILYKKTKIPVVEVQSTNVFDLPLSLIFFQRYILDFTDSIVRAQKMIPLRTFNSQREKHTRILRQELKRWSYSYNPMFSNKSELNQHEQILEQINLLENNLVILLTKKVKREGKKPLNINVSESITIKGLSLNQLRDLIDLKIKELKAD